MNIGGYNFQGPFVSKQMIRDEAGIYVILTRLSPPKIIYVGQSISLRNRITYHEQEPYWTQHAPLGFYYAVYYTPRSAAQQRSQIELEIIRKYKPPCNKLSRLNHYNPR